jgi:hypothetical protein
VGCGGYTGTYGIIITYMAECHHKVRSLSKPVKEAAAPRTDEKGPGKKRNFSMRTKLDELPEIKYDSWLDWDDMMLALK